MISTIDIICLVIVGLIALGFLVIDIWGVCVLLKMIIQDRKGKE